MRVDQLEDLRLDGDVECRRRLVGDQDVGVVDERHRDHRALAHAARKLVRIVARPLLAFGIPTAVRSWTARPMPPAARRPVHANGLGDLLADPIHRVEARERILEDHRESGRGSGGARLGDSFRRSGPSKRISP